MTIPLSIPANIDSSYSAMDLCVTILEFAKDSTNSSKVAGFIMKTLRSIRIKLMGGALLFLKLKSALFKLEFLEGDRSVYDRS